MKKRKDGRICKSITDPRSGKRIFFYGHTEREINKKIIEYQATQERGRTFEEVASEWWKLEVVNLSPSTVRGYEAATKRTVEYFKKAYISELKTADISKYLHYLKRNNFAKKTVKNHKIIVNRIFHHAVIQGDVPFNVAREAELPRGLPEVKRHPATPQEEQTIKTAQNIWLLPFMALMTGMRKGELIGLKWDDIDLESGLIYVRRSVWYGDGGSHIKTPKTEAGNRKIPILAPLRKELEKYTAIPSQFVFGDENPLSEKKYRVLYEKFQEQTGVTATVQQLRKSYATIAVGANVPPDVLKAIFGHTDITTTLNLYAEVRECRILDAAELLNTTM